MARTLAWAAQALESTGLLINADLAGSHDEQWLGATVDTRSECTHRIFFALKGERTDGHRFAEDAHAKGCCAIVVEQKGVADALSGKGIPYLRVNGSLEALQELSRTYRNTLDIRVVAVTGSMGKTTTREYIRAVLKKKYRVHSNPGNLNNHIGVPLTLLETDTDNEYLVCEIGANHTGEIEFLSRLLRPDIGVITNIGDAHIGYFGSREKIAEAKSEIFVGIDPEGYAVLPADDAFVSVLADKAQCRVVTFGMSEASTYVISGVRGGGERVGFEVNGEPMEIRSVGSYNVLNAGAAYAVGEICGVEIDRIRTALLETEPVAGRAKVYRGRDVTLVDDSYNASPTSMRAALESFLTLSAGRKIAVLGDMAELGAYSDSAHRDLGAYLAGSAVDAVYWYGENGKLVAEGFYAPGEGRTTKPGTNALSGGRAGRRAEAGAKAAFKWHTSLDELLKDLEGAINAGDAVLVKGSRACHLDIVVDGLLSSVLEEERD